MKKVAIIPACTDLNRGDQALAWEAVRFVQEIHRGNVDCRIADSGDSPEERKLQSAQTILAGYSIIRNVLGHPRRGVKGSLHTVHDRGLALFLMVVTAAWDFLIMNLLLIAPSFANFLFLFDKEKKAAFGFIENCDEVYVKGGGFLHTYGKISDLYYVWYQTYLIALSVRLRKKVVILPNSFGPFKSGLSKWYLKFILSKCYIIFVREHISLDVLERELALNNCQYGPDFGYFLQPSSSGKFSYLTDGKKKIAITVRPYRFPKSANPQKKYSEYIRAMADFADYMHATAGYQVYFVTQVRGPSAHEDDNVAIKDVRAAMKTDSHHIDIEGNCRDLAELYSNFDLVAGTRFHSVIFSQISRIPAFAIGYGGNKSRGIMRELDLEKYVVDIEDSSGRILIEMFESIKNERSEYIKKLDTGLKIVSAQREEMKSKLSANI